ncbi:MAG: alpha/beta fold hydrolase [Acidimicrobiales bacterium]
MDLPGLGRTFIREAAGPPGAPVLFLLHGLSATGGLNWAPAFALLSREFRVVAIDHRGHGRGIRSRHFRLVDCADDVVATADQLGIDTFAAVGYSMGGPIAQLIWHRHPERVSAMVLCATSRDFRGRINERLVFTALAAVGLGLTPVPRVLSSSGVGWLVKRAISRFSEVELGSWAAGEFRHHDLRLVVEAAAALGRFSSREWIDEVDVPTAVMATTHDQLVPLRRQLKLAQHIATSVVHPIEGDHLAVVRASKQFLSALLESCREVTGSTPPQPRAQASRRLRSLPDPPSTGQAAS